MSRSYLILILGFAMLLCTLGMAEAIERDLVPKGQLEAAPYASRYSYRDDNPVSRSLFWEEDFEIPDAAWQLQSGWNIAADAYKPSPSGINTAFTDNPYENEALYTMLSPQIWLPELPDARYRYNLEIMHWWETETNYDFAQIRLYKDGQFEATILMQSGMQDWVLGSYDLSQYAGSNIQFVFELDSDEADVYAGFGMDFIKIWQEEYSYELEMDLISLNAQNFPFVYATVALQMGEIDVSDLSAQHFGVYENDFLQSNFFSVIPPSTGEGSRLADIVFIMDNSGSMGPYITAISNNVTDFINSLMGSGVDSALGLCRYGASENSGNPILEDNGILSTDLDYFRDNVWNRNVVTGGHEPGYYAMTHSLANFSWRPGAQKVMIIITDETPAQGSVGMQAALDACVENGAILFALSLPGLFGTFTPITEVTGGDVFDLYSSFDDILQQISQIIVSNYIISYRSSNPFFDGTLRNVRITASYLGETAEDFGAYVPGQSPGIMRHPDTIAYDSSALYDNLPIPIQLLISDNHPPYTSSATLYYKSMGTRSYNELPMVNVGGDLWEAEIPAAAVQAPGLSYYFRATDGVSTSSLPSTEPANNPFTIAILPNEAPQVQHAPIVQVNYHSPVGILAEVTDNTDFVESVKLFYRRYGQLSYTAVDMLPSGGDSYQYVIPGEVVAEYGVEYYIQAKDNHGVVGPSGFADNPHYAAALLEGTLILPGDLSYLHFTAENSPFYISGSITVPPGATMIVDPGCELYFAPNSTLTVQGGIIAQGSLFASQSPALAFRGIHIDSAQGEVDFQDCEIQDAINALTIENSGGSYQGLDITTQMQYTGAYGVKILGDSSPMLEDLMILGYNRGIIVENSAQERSGSALTRAASPTLTNIRIRNSSSSSRNGSVGISAVGDVALMVDQAILEDFAIGIDYDGSEIITGRQLPIIRGLMIRTDETDPAHSLRGAVGARFVNLPGLQLGTEDKSVRIIGYDLGIQLQNELGRAGSPTLTNIRIRNTGSASRTVTQGISILGDIGANMSNIELQNLPLGIDYQGTPSQSAFLQNIHINYTDPTFSDIIGIHFKDMGFSLAHGIIIHNLPSGRNPANLDAKAFVVDNSELVIMQSTIWGLTHALESLNGAEAALQYSIVWGAEAGELAAPILENGGLAIVHSSNISVVGGVYPGTNNRDMDPLFAGARQGNFYLRPRSPLRGSEPYIGALPYSYTTLADEHVKTIEPGWNMIGVPYLLQEGMDSPLAVFGEDLSPFTVHPTYTSILQINPNAMPDTLGHVVLDAAANYSVPSVVRPSVGYWVRNPNPHPVQVRFFGYQEPDNYRLELQGNINSWFMLSNPYDYPVSFVDNSIELTGMITPTVLRFNPETNGYQMIDLTVGDEIPPMSSFLILAQGADDEVKLSYPILRGSADLPILHADVTEAEAVEDQIELTEPIWQVILEAKAGGYAASAALGVAEKAQRYYDPLDVPMPPQMPFAMAPRINLYVDNSDWEESAGHYIRDIRASKAAFYSWDLVLDLADIIELAEEEFTLSLSLASDSKIPESYFLSLIDPIADIAVDIAQDEMIIRIDAREGSALPSEIRLRLEARSTTGEAEQRQNAILFARNYPNPFNPSTTISYSLGRDAEVSLDIYNVRGQLVRRLVREAQSAGNHSIVWDGKDSSGRESASGFYFYRLRAGNERYSSKILMMK